MTALRAEKLSRTYSTSAGDVHACVDVDIQVRPGELSGGQQQRVGSARASVARPRVLIADEPTGQLDSGTASTVMDLIGRLVHTQGIAAVVSTHDPLLVQRADRIVELHDGRITSESPGADPAPGTEDRAAPAEDERAAPRTRAAARAQRDAL